MPIALLRWVENVARVMSAERLRQERLEPIRRQRLDCAAAAERRAHHRLHRVGLRLLIAGLLRGFHFLARVLDLLALLLELADRAVLVERRVA